MGLGAWLADVGDDPRPSSFAQLRSELDVRWVEEALQKTGTQSIRRRKLPNEVVVWLVVAMALFRELSIGAVVKHLGLVVPSRRRTPRANGSPLAAGAISRARQRIGSEPLEALFRICTGHWLAETLDQWTWRGLRLCSIDGSTIRLADTPEIEEVYGRPGSDRSKAAYPQARVLSLLALGSRVLIDFVAGMYSQSEQELVKLLWNKLPEHSLTILDRGFVNYGSFASISQMPANRHWMCRAKSRMRFEIISILGKGDYLVRLAVPAKVRKENPSLPKKIVVRLLDYQIAGHKSYRLLTSLIDPKEYPAADLIALYHERWEVEIAFAEKKVQMLQRRETIRSRTPDGVLQELWGLVIGYNLVRTMMARAASAAGVPPRRVSFHNSMAHIRAFLLVAPNVAPGTLPKLYKQLCDDLTHLLLPERRDRSYPRAVKIKMSNYKRKDS